MDKGGGLHSPLLLPICAKCDSPHNLWQGGGGIEVRNFSQFSAIFRQFFSCPDYLTASPRRCRTMRIFFLLCHPLSNVSRSSNSDIAQLVVAMGSNSEGPGFKPRCAQYFYLRFFGRFMPCVFACACRPQDSLLRFQLVHRHTYPLNPSPPALDPFPEATSP